MKLTHTIKTEINSDSAEFLTRMEVVGFDAALKELRDKFNNQKLEIEGWDCCQCDCADTFIEQNDDEGEEFMNHCTACHNIELATKEDVIKFLQQS